MPAAIMSKNTAVPTLAQSTMPAASSSAHTAAVPASRMRRRRGGWDGSANAVIGTLGAQSICSGPLRTVLSAPGGTFAIPLFRRRQRSPGRMALTKTCSLYFTVFTSSYCCDATLLRPSGIARAGRENSPMTSVEISVAERARKDVRTTTIKQAALRSSCHVAVIGAGPYGLSVAAHLKAANVDTRVFGDAMSFWRGNMPKGMRLRSPWCASHLADAKGEFSLDRYAASHGFAPTEQFPREDFVRYGEWFQRMAVPDLDPRKVARVDIAERGFHLRLEDGEVLNARRVVIAVGLANQSFKPSVFEQLPATLASHSSEHASFDAFRGRRVAVIGRGQSACESAVLLSEAGAEVELLSRGKVRWI
ncbi:MAG TPA: NAD(P)-binding domain-containing protein, partial [Xanthobacteraceae bacterium]|nr:NAD(P)-binding domain-containing protein [Xanthobacteraceae bacterium]